MSFEFLPFLNASHGAERTADISLGARVETISCADNLFADCIQSFTSFYRVAGMSLLLVPFYRLKAKLADTVSHGTSSVRTLLQWDS